MRGLDEESNTFVTELWIHIPGVRGFVFGISLKIQSSVSSILRVPKNRAEPRISIADPDAFPGFFFEQKCEDLQLVFFFVGHFLPSWIRILFQRAN
jgi:hypothetical protein